MTSNSIRMLNLSSTEDQSILMEEARQHFVRNADCISEEYRIPDHIDVHHWVAEFITNSVWEGRIHDDDLLVHIMSLTYNLWIEALRIVEEREQDDTDGEAHNE